ncbi:MAG: TAT-variant-translocated molybdopterin oxidoreductase [Verrucomicrobiota bacterium]
MKTIPPPCPEPDTGPKYWRSLDQLADKPEFRQWLEREFPEGASEFTDAVSRRYFVKIMSASFLLAGLGATGCRRPVENIMPFAKQPENYIHGVPQKYATAMPIRGTAIPLVVESNDGRPTKIEGNALHPDSNGGTDHFAQASVLNLYDPDRSMRFAKQGGVTAKREEALDFLSSVAQQAAGNGGAGLCFLSERTNSPSRDRVQKLIAAKYPQAKWFVYEPVDFDIAREAATVAFGKPVTPYFKFDEAEIILSLDSDFLALEENAYLNIRRFAKTRRLAKAGDKMSRLYVVEGLFTLTGANADNRLRVATSQVQGIAAHIALAIVKDSSLQAPLQAMADAVKLTAAQQSWVAECAKDLAHSGAKAVVVAGYRQPLEAHLIAHAINSALGAVGTTVALQDYDRPANGTLAELAEQLNAGSVDTLVILGGNPVYNAPADLNWTVAQGKAKTVIRLGYYEDETTASKTAPTLWHLPQAHYLESWGDARTADGTVAPVQPLIQPLFGGLTELEVLARLGGLEKTNPHDIVRETFRGLAGDDENKWRKFLHDGFLAGSAAKAGGASLSFSAVAARLGAAKTANAPTSNSLEVVFYRSHAMDDGRYANNGWLQETPDPITKLVWDNAVLMSPATADALGVGKFKAEARNNEASAGLFENQIVEVSIGARKVEGPVWIQPGMADNVVGISLGYGRKVDWRIARGQHKEGTGFDGYRLRTAAAPYIAAGAKVTGTSATRALASTQEHGAMEGRPIIREANLAQFEKNPQFAVALNTHEPPAPLNQPIYKNPFDEFKKRGVHQWGMVIDLNTCVGCSACVLACQSENNIPIAGKDQVRRGREMSWIRLDRYFSGNVNDPQAAFQVMLCQHCEAAPCENVCPVNATAHNEEGLNVMAYNRCVGTRYCSNNCPYKVRRFNYLDFNRRPLDSLKGPVYSMPILNSVDGEWELARWWKNPDRGLKPDEEWDLLALVKNPDVTVRMRGVMEKCSFCLQRIEQAKIAQKVKAGPSGDVQVPEGVIKTACQQACPAGAITFGNLNDANSEVSKAKQNPRNYTVLDYLATKPRTTYLARVRNPNPNIKDSYETMPGTTDEYVKKNHVKGDPFATHHGSDHGAPAAAGKGGHH